MSELGLRATSALGIAVLIGIAWLFATERRALPWRRIAIAIGLQLALALLILKTAPGRAAFVAINDGVVAFLSFTDAGARFVFGALLDTGFSFALQVLPVIVFMGSLFSILYHLGVVQWLVTILARGLSRAFGTSDARAAAPRSCRRRCSRPRRGSPLPRCPSSARARAQAR